MNNAHDVLPPRTVEGGVDVQDIYAMLMESQGWSQEDMRDYQRSQLEQLLLHAKSTVPFYKSRLDCVFRRDGSIDWERWGEIPILTRQDVRNNQDALVTQALPAGHGKMQAFRTSGSTGQPISVMTSTLMSMTNKAATKRVFANHRIGADLKRAYTRAMFADDTPLETDFAYWRAGQISDKDGALYVNRNLPMARRLDILHDEGAGILIDFPTAVELLAHENLKRAIPVRLAYIIGYGMGFTARQRAFNLASFGAKTISSYSCKEGGIIASQCATSLNFHVDTELVLLEQPPIGGGVVITPFYQMAQPFIRYRLDDDVQLMERCGCGHGLATLTSIHGKVDPIFHFHGSLAVVPLEPVLGKSQFYQWASAIQIAQTSPTGVEVRYVADHKATMAHRTELNLMMRQMWYHDLIVTYVLLKDLPRNAGGKQQRFVSEIEKDTRV